MSEAAPTTILDMFMTLLRIRIFEEHLADLLEAGEVNCPCLLYTGQEAIATRVCAALVSRVRSSLTRAEHRGAAGFEKAHKGLVSACDTTWEPGASKGGDPLWRGLEGVSPSPKKRDGRVGGSKRSFLSYQRDLRVRTLDADDYIWGGGTARRFAMTRSNTKTFLPVP